MFQRLRAIQTIVATGIFGALCFLVTAFLGIPYAGGAGYFSFGDAISLLATYLFGPIVGLGTALIGGVFADLAKGYALFIPSTILAKSIMVLASFGVMFLLRKHPRLSMVGIFVGGLLMPFGYLPIDLSLYGEAAWVSFGFDVVQGVGGALIAMLLAIPLKKALGRHPESKSM